MESIERKLSSAIDEVIDLYMAGSWATYTIHSRVGIHSGRF